MGVTSNVYGSALGAGFSILPREFLMAYGGLGSLVCEAVATNGIDTKVIRVGVEDLPISEYGDSEFLEKRFMTDIGLVVEEVSRGKRHK